MSDKSGKCHHYSCQGSTPLACFCVKMSCEWPTKNPTATNYSLSNIKLSMRHQLGFRRLLSVAGNGPIHFEAKSLEIATMQSSYCIQTKRQSVVRYGGTIARRSNRPTVKTSILHSPFGINPSTCCFCLVNSKVARCGSFREGRLCLCRGCLSPRYRPRGDFEICNLADNSVGSYHERMHTSPRNYAFRHILATEARTWRVIYKTLGCSGQ